MTLHFVSVHIHAFDGGNVCGGRHKLNNGVDELLDTLVLVRAAAANGNSRTFAGGLAKHLLELLGRGLFALEEDLSQVVIQFADLLDQLCSVHLGIILHLCRDLADGDVVAFVIVIDIGFHLEQVDDTPEGVLRPDRNLDHDRVLSKTVADLLNTSEKVGTDYVHFVDERHTGHVIGVCLTPDIFRLRLDAALSTENADRTVENSEGTLDLDCKVDVAGSVDDVDPALLLSCLDFHVIMQRPVACCRCRCDGDSALLLLVHPVHGRGALVGLTNLIIDTGIIENSFCQSSLARVDVGHNTDVPGPFQGVLSC